MTNSVAGIDPHQDTFTIGIVDGNGVEITNDTFANTSVGFCAAIDLLRSHSVQMVGVEGSASWGTHISIALVAAGFDAREVPAQQSRSRRLAKTDIIDVLCVARSLLAEPTLGPVKTLEVYDQLVAKIQAVLEHRRMLVDVRTLALHHIQGQLMRLPTDVRDLLSTSEKIEARLRRLESLEPGISTSTMAGTYRLGWLVEYVEQDRDARRAGTSVGT